MTKHRKHLLTALKLIISGVLVYFIFSKLDLKTILNILKTTYTPYLILAVVFFIVSKVISAYRLNLYFYQIKVFLAHTSNLKLLLLGMFYNLFLPGGIGGDAYKGYVIQKEFPVETKKVVSVLILDRLSGLLLIFIYACGLALLIENELIITYNFLFVIGIIAAPICFYFLSKIAFSYTLPVFGKSIVYSALVQLAQLISVYFILKALAIEEDIATYLFIFLISSIVAVLPVSIGGIGLREVTFFYGAQWLHLNESISVSISTIFFLITALVSLFGVYYHFKKIKLISTAPTT